MASCDDECNYCHHRHRRRGADDDRWGRDDRWGCDDRWGRGRPVWGRRRPVWRGRRPVCGGCGGGLRAGWPWCPLHGCRWAAAGTAPADDHRGVGRERREGRVRGKGRVRWVAHVSGSLRVQAMAATAASGWLVDHECHDRYRRHRWGRNDRWGCDDRWGRGRPVWGRRRPVWRGRRPVCGGCGGGLRAGWPWCPLHGCRWAAAGTAPADDHRGVGRERREGRVRGKGRVRWVAHVSGSLRVQAMVDVVGVIARLVTGGALAACVRSGR
jgi:hypothetical protein